VVPTGDATNWKTPPFEPTIIDDVLYGRGAQDMKGALAAMIIAAETYIKKNPNHPGRIGFLITSGEEGFEYANGTPVVVDYLQKQAETIDWCIVGEPSSHQKVGDTLRNGRRGSLKGFLTVHGVQGHVAYPELARNPIHMILPALDELTSLSWDKGNGYFPPTIFQIANINAGTGEVNVIPAELKTSFSFRYSTELTAEKIEEQFTAVLDKHRVNYTLTWELSGKPFLTKPGELIAAVNAATQMVTGITPQLSTGGGTSDARFIAPMGAQVIELGTTNDKIHQMNESVKIEELETLTQIYEQILVNLLDKKTGET